jgi:hypothetical protein
MIRYENRALAKCLELQHNETVPIRPELRHFYGRQWRRKRSYALARRGSESCQQCGQQHRMLNWAHLSGDPRIAGPMGWLCPSCHARHDTRFRIAATRRTRARRSGQRWLSPEIEWGYLPMYLWPAHVIRSLENDAQMPLFPCRAA